MHLVSLFEYALDADADCVTLLHSKMKVMSVMHLVSLFEYALVCDCGTPWICY